MTFEANSIITGTMALWHINFRHIIFKELSLAIRNHKGVGYVAIGIWKNQNQKSFIQRMYREFVDTITRVHAK